MIPPPRNVLVSYHYFKNYDLDRLAGLHIIGDSGAFSADTQGAEITTEEMGEWAVKWNHRLLWAASLDVLKSADQTRTNWNRMVDEYSVEFVPSLHIGEDPSGMDYYADRGVDFIGLGGMVGMHADKQMRWLLQVFKYARDHHPDMRFHGWGMSNPKVLQLPFYSVDSSGWGAGYRYGRLALRDPITGEVVPIQLDGRQSYSHKVATLLRDHYGVNPSEVATSGPHNRPLMVRLSALSASVQEQEFRKLHRRNPITAPTWGITAPTIALAAQPSELSAFGPHMHLADTSSSTSPQNLTGPHIHLAEGSSEHLEIVKRTGDNL